MIEEAKDIEDLLLVQCPQLSQFTQGADGNAPMRIRQCIAQTLVKLNLAIVDKGSIVEVNDGNKVGVKLVAVDEEVEVANE